MVVHPGADKSNQECRRDDEIIVVADQYFGLRGHQRQRLSADTREDGIDRPQHQVGTVAAGDASEGSSNTCQRRAPRRFEDKGCQGDQYHIARVKTDTGENAGKHDHGTEAALRCPAGETAQYTGQQSRMLGNGNAHNRYDDRANGGKAGEVANGIV